MHRLLLFVGIFLLVGCFKASIDTVPPELVKQPSANTTPGAIRKWLAKTATEHLSATNKIELSPEQWPPWMNSLTNNAPMRVFLERDKAEVSASIVWNYSRGLHGIDLHSSTNALPRDPKLFQSEEWVPGIYAWHARGD